jgi:hypothetical protein
MYGLDRSFSIIQVIIAIIFISLIFIIILVSFAMHQVLLVVALLI